MLFERTSSLRASTSIMALSCPPGVPCVRAPPRGTTIQLYFFYVLQTPLLRPQAPCRCSARCTCRSRTLPAKTRADPRVPQLLSCPPPGRPREGLRWALPRRGRPRPGRPAAQRAAAGRLQGWGRGRRRAPPRPLRRRPRLPRAARAQAARGPLAQRRRRRPSRRSLGQRRAAPRRAARWATRRRSRCWCRRGRRWRSCAARRRRPSAASTACLRPSWCEALKLPYLKLCRPVTPDAPPPHVERVEGGCLREAGYAVVYAIRCSDRFAVLADRDIGGAAPARWSAWRAWAWTRAGGCWRCQMAPCSCCTALALARARCGATPARPSAPACQQRGVTRAHRRAAARGSGRAPGTRPARPGRRRAALRAFDARAAGRWAASATWRPTCQCGVRGPYP